MSCNCSIAYSERFLAVQIIYVYWAYDHAQANTSRDTKEKPNMVLGRTVHDLLVMSRLGDKDITLQRNLARFELLDFHHRLAFKMPTRPAQGAIYIICYFKLFGYALCREMHGIRNWLEKLATLIHFRFSVVDTADHAAHGVLAQDHGYGATRCCNNLCNGK